MRFSINFIKFIYSHLFEHALLVLIYKQCDLCIGLMMSILEDINHRFFINKRLFTIINEIGISIK